MGGGLRRVRGVQGICHGSKSPRSYLHFLFFYFFSCQERFKIPNEGDSLNSEGDFALDHLQGFKVEIIILFVCFSDRKTEIEMRM